MSNIMLLYAPIYLAMNAKKPGKASKKSSGPDVTSPESPLLKDPALPPQIRENIIYLLKLGNNPCLDPGDNQCQAKDPSLPRNCLETVAFVLGLDFVSQREKAKPNSYFMGYPSEPSLDDRPGVHEFINMIKGAGYKRVMEIKPFKKVPSKDKYDYKFYNGRLKKLSSLDSLIPGDVLAFGFKYDSSVPNSDDLQGDFSVKHACVYLGKFKGKHYVFEKPSFKCGPDSPYKIICLEDRLKRAIGEPSYCDNFCYDTLFVYRK